MSATEMHIIQQKQTYFTRSETLILLKFMPNNKNTTNDRELKKQKTKNKTTKQNTMTTE